MKFQFQHLTITAFFICSAVYTLSAQRASEHITIYGNIIPEKAIEDVQIFYSFGDSLYRTALVNTDEFIIELESKLPKYNTSLDKIRLYIIEKADPYNYQTINDFPKGTLRLDVLLDTGAVCVNIDLLSGKHKVEGGYENGVKDEFDSVKKIFQHDLLLQEMSVDSVYKKRYLAELNIIKKYPRSVYAFEKMHSFLSPSTGGLKDGVLETLARFDTEVFGEQTIEDMYTKFEKFFLSFKEVDENFLGLERVDFVKAIGSKEYLEHFRATEYLLIDIWATWCAPCIKAHKELNAFVSTLSNQQKLSVIGLAVMSDYESWEKYLNKNALAFDSYWVDWEKERDKFKHLKLSGVPLYLLIRTKDGKIIERSILFENMKKILSDYI